jgi:hypothetical protein
MQTFMPSVEYAETAKILDNKRLNKQALEGWQILMNLLELDPQGNHRPPKGWSNHPAVKMWRGHEFALYVYVLAMVREWQARGFKSTIGDKARATVRAFGLDKLVMEQPTWLCDVRTAESVASSHRLALLAKNYEWYSQFGWEEDPGYAPTEYEYTWPVE